MATCTCVASLVGAAGSYIIIKIYSKYYKGRYGGFETHKLGVRINWGLISSLVKIVFRHHIQYITYLHSRYTST